MKKMMVLPILFFSLQGVAKPAADVIPSKMKEGVAQCPSEVRKIAEEVLKAELAGRRALDSKASCYKDLELSYLSASKNPDNAAQKIFKVKSGGAQILEVVYNKNYYIYEAKFSAENSKGEKRKDSISFMLNTPLGKKRPKTGCAMIATEPETAYVLETCL